MVATDEEPSQQSDNVETNVGITIQKGSKPVNVTSPSKNNNKKDGDKDDQDSNTNLEEKDSELPDPAPSTDLLNLPVVGLDDINSTEKPPKPLSSSSLSSLSSLSSSEDDDDSDDEFLSKDMSRPSTSTAPHAPIATTNTASASTTNPSNASTTATAPRDAEDLLDASMQDMNTSDLSDPDSEAETERLDGTELEELDKLEAEHRQSVMNFVPASRQTSQHVDDDDGGDGDVDDDDDIDLDDDDDNIDGIDDSDDDNLPPLPNKSHGLRSEDDEGLKAKDGDSILKESLSGDKSSESRKVTPCKKRAHSLSKESSKRIKLDGDGDNGDDTIHEGNNDEDEMDIDKDNDDEKSKTLKPEPSKQKSSSPNPLPNTTSTKQSSLPLAANVPAIDSNPDNGTKPLGTDLDSALNASKPTSTPSSPPPPPPTIDEDASNTASKLAGGMSPSNKNIEDSHDNQIQAHTNEELADNSSTTKNDKTKNTNKPTNSTKQRPLTVKTETSHFTDDEDPTGTDDPASHVGGDKGNGNGNSDKKESHSSNSKEKKVTANGDNDTNNENETNNKEDESLSDADDSTGVPKKPTDEELLAAQQAERKEALSMLSDIEVEFAKLRDQLHSNKLAQYVAEIEMCAEGTHPELEKACSDIQSVRNERVKRAELRRKYQRICIDIQTRANREHLHQQFMKDRAEIRAELLRTTTEEWYRVNRERRQMDSLVSEYGFRPSMDPVSQSREFKSYNDEVSLLSNINKIYGFPAAPVMRPSTKEEIEEDFRLFAIGANRNIDNSFYRSNGGGSASGAVANNVNVNSVPGSHETNNHSINSSMPPSMLQQQQQQQSSSTFGTTASANSQTNGSHSRRRGNHYVAHQHYYHHHHQHGNNH